MSDNIFAVSVDAAAIVSITTTYALVTLAARAACFIAVAGLAGAAIMADMPSLICAIATDACFHLAVHLHVI